MADLFEGCSDDEVTIKTDNYYAKRYDEWRRKEELMKAKARFGSDLENSSSSDEEEDDEASQWTSEHEKKFLTTLSALKARDPKIYNKDEIIFPEVSSAEQKTTEKAEKMTLKDYERKIMTTEGGVYADEEDVERQRKNIFEETQADKLAYDAEQRELRESLKKAVWDSGEALEHEEDEDGGLFARKESKTQEEQAQNDEEYIKWLKGETKKLSNKKDAKDLATLKQLWSSEGEEKLDDAEKFLRDYVLNKRYLAAKEEEFGFEVDFSEDEKDITAMTEFEHKYNFRFEDPDPEFIKRYPRTIEDSMRRKDTRRIDKKAEKKARKEQLKVQMKEEVNRLKSFKKKEILEKIDKLKTIAGSGDIAFEDDDIEGDFDPEEHDKRMAALFSSYDKEAGEDNYPEIDDKEHEDLRWENWDLYQGEATNEEPSSSSSRRKHFEEEAASDDSGETSDANEDENESESDTEHTREKVSVEKREQQTDTDDSDQETKGDGIERNEAGKMVIRGKKSAKLVLEDVLPKKSERKRKKSKFAEVISKKKPSFDPEKDKSFEKYFDEYYKLDFEDVVAGLPTRFKYRQVLPNDFGLSTEEVLQSQDKELNKWCSLKKMIQYRSKEEEDKDLQVFSKRRDHFHLKKKILTSAYTADEEKLDDEIAEASGKHQEEPAKKSKSRKNKKKKTLGKTEGDTEKTHPADAEKELEEVEEVAETPATSKKRKSEFSDSQISNKRKKQQTKAESEAKSDVTDTEAESFSPRRKKPESRGKKRKTLATESGEETKKRKASETETEDDSKERKTLKKDSSKSDVDALETVPWDKLTPKQKKNRRNAMIKKRKKLEQKQQRAENIKMKKQKFKPLEDLQISDARMKAYGLNPKRVKGDLVYGERKNKKTSL